MSNDKFNQWLKGNKPKLPTDLKEILVDDYGVLTKSQEQFIRNENKN